MKPQEEKVRRVIKITVKNKDFLLMIPRGGAVRVSEIRL